MENSFHKEKLLWFFFPLFSQPWCLIQGWHCKENLDASQVQWSTNLQSSSEYCGIFFPPPEVWDQFSLDLVVYPYLSRPTTPAGPGYEMKLVLESPRCFQISPTKRNWQFQSRFEGLTRVLWHKFAELATFKSILGTYRVILVFQPPDDHVSKSDIFGIQLTWW